MNGNLDLTTETQAIFPVGFYTISVPVLSGWALTAACGVGSPRRVGEYIVIRGCRGTPSSFDAFGGGGRLLWRRWRPVAVDALRGVGGARRPWTPLEVAVAPGGGGR